jgi:hypothetical protein
MEGTTTDRTFIAPPDADTLLRTAKWARFIGLVGMALAALMVLGSFFIGAFFNRMMAMQTEAMGMSGMQQTMVSGVGVFYTVFMIISAGIYFVPSWLMHRFGNRTRKALSGPFDAEAFSEGLVAHRRMYTFMGVLTILVLVIYGFALLMMAVTWSMMPTPGPMI